jgi:hypothetical protein
VLLLENERMYMGRGNELVLNLVQVEVHRSSKKHYLVFKKFSFAKPWSTNEQK